MLVFVQVCATTSRHQSLREPNSIAVSADVPRSMSHFGRHGIRRGGVAKFTNLGATTTLVPPTSNVTYFTNFQGLTLSTGAGDDSIAVRAAPQTTTTTIRRATVSTRST